MVKKIFLTNSKGETMMKKILVLMGVIVLILGLTGSAAAENPPWEAYQAWEDTCFSLWMTPEGDITYVYGVNHVLYIERTGIWSGVCNQYYDFDSGELATLEQVCSLYPDYCNGRGTFIWEGFDCYHLIPGETEMRVTTDSFQLVNSAGQGVFYCNYNPSSD